MMCPHCCRPQAHGCRLDDLLLYVQWEPLCVMHVGSPVACHGKVAVAEESGDVFTLNIK